ncbi:arabinofuranosidase [Coprinellus micaceus]|uniref:non-reducing end alpha-L-arabinofuranosidase n=1 Tax=Coprinellus micaceus TaxID=71717 RepID=A0A4Y7SRI5_COPMI|nr:arabinofuranosidase [Coprinellus micaceus]
MLGVSSSAVLLLAVVSTAMVNAITVNVSETASHPIPKTLCEFGNSGDGGLYAELLKNRALQLVTPGTSAVALTGWQALNGATISVVRESTPVSAALPNAIQVRFPTGRTGNVGFANTGYNGIKVQSSWKYTASFYYRLPTSSPAFTATSFILTLQTTSGQVLASTTVSGISGNQTTWRQMSVDLYPSANAANTNNVFAIQVDAARARGATVNFAMLSLMPPTYKGRANGMRIDLAEALAVMKPGIFRFPGGNNLEGQTVDTRWKWRNTVGPLVDRPGRMGDWSYINTDGLGLLEYLYWCEDLDAEPIMGVWAGYALGGTSVPENQLDPYIQEAVDQINFAIGDPAKSSAAALRASLGRSEPFKLLYVEIGNEVGPSPHVLMWYRWRRFVTRLKQEFPQLRFMATTRVGDPRLDPTPTEYDVHEYNVPTWFAQNTFYYDGFARNGTKYFEGEYAAISNNPNNMWNERFTFPTIGGAVSEAAYMTGLERNSDIVFSAAYAPLIGHVSNNQWTPNLLGHDAGAVYYSTSYYVQKLFGTNRGDEYLPSTLPDRLGTAFWSVVRNKASNEVIVKIANTATAQAQFTFNLPFNTVASTGSLQTLSGTWNQSNTPSDANLIVPRTSTLTGIAKTFNFNAPGASVNILTFVAS